MSSERQPLLRPEAADDTPVYPIIHMIRADVIRYIDTPLSPDALIAPDLTYTVVRPLVEKYAALQHDGNLAIVFCFLINRVHFLRDENMATQSLSFSRANLCEILATRIFRETANNMLKLTIALTTSWYVYNGADPAVIAQAREERDEDLDGRVGNAIEMAIIGKSKRFIKSSACQKVIDGIWSGKCVYQAQSSHSILSDTYKRTPIHFYDPHKAPLLDHYRLKVPSIRSVLEYTNFLILFILFVVAIEFSKRETINVAEILFMVYALGFTLEKVAAMQEHGIKVYFKGTWNGFDLAFITQFFIYAFFRIYGVYYDREWARAMGMDVLALIACLIFPRLAFVTFKDNLMVLSLRAMIIQFMFLMLIATFCFCGFLYALWTLSRDEAGYSAGQISWWMLDLYFGLDASGFDNATKFHQTFGPILMVTYACLSNTLLLTVLVSILSNTFASVNEDAAAEAMFRKAVSTIEGVKADFLFSYQPPVNLVALCILLPASYILSPRWFHKFNVFLIRLTSFPILITISVYERQSKQASAVTFYDTVAHVAEKFYNTLPRSLKRINLFEGLAGADADIDAVFEIEQEFDSALDMGDNDSSPIHDGQQHIRRRSAASSKHRRASGGQAAHAIATGYGATPITASPPRAMFPRARLNSVLSRPGFESQTFSPLAQIYNPGAVVVEDPADTIGPEPSSAHPGYGLNPPRRRLTSIQAYQRRAPVPVIDAPDTGGRHHEPDEGHKNSKPFQLMDEDKSPSLARMRSRSQEAYVRQSASGGNPSGNDLHDHAKENPAVLRRLEEIEKRQARIENLLLQISRTIQP